MISATSLTSFILSSEISAYTMTSFPGSTGSVKADPSGPYIYEPRYYENKSSTDSPNAYHREATSGECEPWISKEFHLFGACFADYLTADDSKNATLHGHELAHPTRRLSTDYVGRSTSVWLKCGPPSTHENLGVLGIENGLQPGLYSCGK